MFFQTPQPGLFCISKLFGVFSKTFKHHQLFESQELPKTIPGPPVDGEDCILSNVQLYANVIIVKTWIEMMVSTSPCGWGGHFAFFLMYVCRNTSGKVNVSGHM